MRRFLPLALALAPVACSGPAPGAAPLEGARIGGPWTLVNQDGRTVTDRDFAGKYRIMYFGYTFCPDVCPTDVQNIAAGLRLLDEEKPDVAARVQPIFVTVDPARDTPAAVKQFVRAFSPTMTGLTGTPEAIGRTAKAYGIYNARGQGTAGGYLVDHSRQIYLMSPDNKPIALLPEGPPRAIADEVAKWVR